MANEIAIRITANDDASLVMGRVSDNAKKLGVTLAAGLAGAAATAGAAVLASVKSYVDLGDSLDEMASRTGFGVEALSELQHAAKLSGSDLSGLEASVRRMQRTVTDAAGGSKSAADALGALGVSVSELEGLSPEEQFNKLTAALADVEDASEKAALAQELFGRNGTALLPMLDGGAAGLAAMRQEARELGVVMSEDDAKAAAQLADIMDNVKERLSGAMLSIARVAVPVLLDLAEWLGPRLTAAGEVAKALFATLSDHVGVQLARWRPFYEAEVRPALENIMRGVEGVVGFIAEHWPRIQEVIQPVLEQVQLTVETVFGVIAGIVRTVLDVIQGDWAGAWENIQGVLGTVLEFMRGTVENVLALIGNLLEAAVKVLGAVASRIGDAIRDGLVAGFEAVKGRVAGIIDAILGFLDRILGKAADVKRAIDAVASFVGGAAGAVGDVASAVLPGFAAGGVVPGAVGAPMLAVVHGGETVIPVGGGAGGMVVNLTVNAGIGTDGHSVGEQIVTVLNRHFGSGGTKLDTRAVG